MRFSPDSRWLALPPGSAVVYNNGAPRPHQLWTLIIGQLRDYVEANVRALLAQVTPTVDQSLLGGRLLNVVAPPSGSRSRSCSARSRERWAPARRSESMAGAARPMLVWDWRSSSSEPSSPDRLAVVALTPGAGTDPIIDLVVASPVELQSAERRPVVGKRRITPRTSGRRPSGGHGPGTASRNRPPSVERKAGFQIGMTTGPGMQVRGFSIRLEAVQAASTSVTVDLTGLEISLLAQEISKLVGAVAGDATISTRVGPGIGQHRGRPPEWNPVQR